MLAERGREPFVEPIGLLRRGRAAEPRTATSAGVREQRELGHDQRLAADIDERSVDPTFLVAEDPQLRHSPCEGIRDARIVVVADADQNHEPLADRRDDLLTDADRRPCRPLQQGPHALVANEARQASASAWRRSRDGPCASMTCSSTDAGMSRS
jgi:hypothetical protein